MNKVSWLDLSAEEQEHFVKNVANGCGPAWCPGLQKFLYRFFFAHLFHGKCIQHDFNFMRGGGLYDYLKANWDMTRFVFIDFAKALVFLCVGIVYLLAITFFGWLSFTFGDYRSKEEILTTPK